MHCQVERRGEVYFLSPPSSPRSAMTLGWFAELDTFTVACSSEGIIIWWADILELVLRRRETGQSTLDHERDLLQDMKRVGTISVDITWRVVRFSVGGGFTS